MTADLIERLEAATEPSRELDKDIVCVKDGRNPADYRIDAQFYFALPRYTSSIDAALTLVPGGMDWDVGYLNVNGEKPVAHVMRQIKHSDPEYDGDGAHYISFASKGATPAIALCIAALKAREPKP